MKLLLDSSMWPVAAEELRAAGHDVVYAGDWPGVPTDGDLFDLALAEGRIVVTSDRNLGEHGPQNQRKPGILRIVSYYAARQADVCLMILSQHGDQLARGFSATVCERSKEPASNMPWRKGS